MNLIDLIINIDFDTYFDLHLELELDLNLYFLIQNHQNLNLACFFVLKFPRHIHL